MTGEIERHKVIVSRCALYGSNRSLHGVVRDKCGLGAVVTKEPVHTFRNCRRPTWPLSRRSIVATLGVVALVFTSAALGATYPSPPHDFGPVAGAGPLYNAVNAATPRPLLVVQTTFSDIATPAGLNDAATAARLLDAYV